MGVGVMLIDTTISVAFKNSLWQYEMAETSMFNLTDVDKWFTNVEINLKSFKEIQLKVKCPLCNDYHYYSYSVSQLKRSSMVIGGCERIGSPVFFIGNKEKVEEKINKYKEVNKKIYAML